MKPIQLGIWLAIGLLGLLWLALSAPIQAAQIDAAPLLQADGPESSPGAEVVISQQPELVLTTTVGSVVATCGVTRTIQVRRNTLVYPCYTVENRGAITLTLHRIASQRQGVITDSFPLTLAPGMVTNTVALGFVLTDVTAFDVTDLVTWTAQAAQTVTPTQPITRTDRIVIDVITPTLSVVKTVGIDRAGCPATQNLRVPTGSTVYYCLRVENQGDEALTRHELVDGPLNLRATVAYTVRPGRTWVITSGVLAELGVNGSLQRANVNAPFTNTVTLTSTTASGISARAASTASISVGTTTVVFTKTVGLDPNECSPSSTFSLPLDRSLFYCVSILNTGEVTLTSHTLSEPNLAIDVTFDYALAPGALLTITNRVLTETLGQFALFGPFEYSGRYPNVVNNTMRYTGLSTEGTNVTSSSATQVTAPPTATPTFTPSPRPPSTNTPFPTNTPGPTSTPVPATATPTPTFTPQTPTATPTRSYAVSSLTTPTSTPLSAAAVEATAQAASAATATSMATSMATLQESAAQPDSALATPDGQVITEGVTEGVTETGPALPVVPGEQALGEAGDEVAEGPAATTPSPTVSATPAIVVIVVTDTPTPSTPLDPLRPVVPPPPTATPDYLMAAATAIDAMAAAAGWIWFLVGSLVFFITAGIVAGFFFGSQGAQRFDLEPGEDEAFWLPEDAYLPDAPLGSDELDEDDEWPAHLP